MQDRSALPRALAKLRDEAALSIDALANLEEIDGAVTPITLLTAVADSLGMAVTFRGRNGAILRIEGSPTALTGDLTVASGSADWNTATETEGKVKITGFDWTPYVGKWIRVLSGTTPGAMVRILKNLGSNTARVSGGLDELYAIDGFAHWTAGDVIRICELTQWDGPLYSASNYGDCQLIFSKLRIGPTGSVHEFKTFATGSGLLFFNCELRGLDISGGDGYGVIMAGSHTICSHVKGGRLGIAAGCSWESGPGAALNMRQNGHAILSQWNCFQGCAPTLGGSEGGGRIVCDEGNAVCDYPSGISLSDASTMDINGAGKLWLRDAASASVGMTVLAGCGVHCATAANLPKIVGTHPATDYLIDKATKTQAELDAGPGFSTDNARIVTKA